MKRLLSFIKIKILKLVDIETKKINILHLATNKVFLESFIKELNKKNLREDISLLFNLSHSLYLSIQR